MHRALSTTTTLAALVGLFAVPAVAQLQVGCTEYIKGRDFSGWYQQCMDQIANQVCDPCGGSVSNDSGGCTCTYLSEVPGAWAGARQSVWDNAINKHHDCSGAYFLYKDAVNGAVVAITWSCH